MPEFSMKPSDAADDIREIATHIGDAPISPATSLSALALSMAMKYADINTVQEGTLYQQYKLEGREILPLSLHYVFHIAEQIERHLIQAPSRLADAVLEGFAEALEAELPEEDRPLGSEPACDEGNPAPDEPPTPSVEGTGE